MERLQKAAEWIDLPKEIFPLDTHLELFGNRQVLLDGACEITECGEDILVLKAGKRTLCFRGTELTLTSFDAKSAVLEGHLSSIEFK